MLDAEMNVQGDVESVATSYMKGTTSVLTAAL